MQESNNGKKRTNGKAKECPVEESCQMDQRFHPDNASIAWYIQTLDPIPPNLQKILDQKRVEKWLPHQKIQKNQAKRY